MKNENPKIWIGIDPDIDKSGVAVWDSSRCILESIECLSFFDAIETIELLDEFYNAIVIIEAGWLIKKSNWHGAKNKNIAAKIGANVGANHQVGRLFAEYCTEKDVNYVLERPMGKKDAKEFKRLTGWTRRTNSEQRDSAMLVFGR